MNEDERGTAEFPSCPLGRGYASRVLASPAPGANRYFRDQLHEGVGRVVIGVVREEGLARRSDDRLAS